MTTKKLSKVYKSNELNESNFNDYNLSIYRVFLTVLSKLQRHDSNGDPLPLELISRECTLSAKEYEKLFPSVGNRAYEILQQAAKKLMKTSITLPYDAKNIIEINACSSAVYKKSDGLINIRFTEEIMPHLKVLEGKFTMYNLSEIAGFGSIYTTRLYELLMQFKITGKLEISIPNLREKLACTKIFERYNNFKQRAIQHAVDEINSQWTLDLTYQEIKNGRTVTDLVFTFKPTFSRKAYDPVTKKLRTQLTRPRRKTKEEISTTKPKKS
jgi:plasmid replication initiation protein